MHLIKKCTWYMPSPSLLLNPPPPQGGDVKWALAGRSREKLEALRQELSGTYGAELRDVPILTADLADQASLDALASSARVRASSGKGGGTCLPAWRPAAGAQSAAQSAAQSGALPSPALTCPVLPCPPLPRPALPCMLAPA